VTPGGSAPYNGGMKAALTAVLAAAAAVTAGCGGSHAQVGPAPRAHGPLLGGQVQVVRYSSSNVRICPNFATALDFGPAGPPPCTDGLRVVGVETGMLTEHAKGHTERWGSLYLVGSYRAGVFSVTKQRLHGPAAQPASATFDRPPCATPPGGWVLATRTDAQQRSLEHYSKLAGHHDLVDIAFFDHGSVLTVASSNPARTRRVLGPYWPRQLCVVEARYSRATLVHVGKRLVRLMTSPRSAAYGWITGAGGTCGNDTGQPTTCVEVLIETRQLRALLGRLPRGLVVVQAALHPLGHG
jgi:hypothetical protein